MKRLYGICLLSAGLMLLAGCDDSNDSSSASKPAVSVDDLSPGSYAVSVGDSNNPSAGKYYAGTDGSRLLVVDNSDAQASVLYRRAAGGDWVAVPTPGTNVSVSLLHRNMLPAVNIDIASLAGSYATRLASGTIASFSVSSTGSIIAGSSTCKLSGKLSAGGLPSTLSLSLTTSACDSLPSSSTGILTIDADDQPAVFRLISDDGKQLVDILAYAE